MSDDVIEEEKIKDTFTAEELLAEIRKTEPDYDPGQPKIVRLRPLPDVSAYEPMAFDKLELDIPPPREYVVYPCLPTQGIGWVYAPTGVGKTLFTLNLAYAIAGGGNFLKYTCPKPRKVLYIDGEMAYNQLHARLMLIANQQGELDFKANLSFITPDKMIGLRMPMIDDPAGQEVYEKLLKIHGYEVIIFDNLSMLSSFDENKAHEWKPIQDWLLSLRQQGKTIIIVHHAGKGGSYRGTSRMIDCADVVISLQPVNDSGMEDENPTAKKFKIVYQKARDFGGQDAFPFEASLDNGEWMYQSLEKTDMDRVIDMYWLKMTQMTMAKELNCGQPKIAKLIKKARRLGLIRDDK